MKFKIIRLILSLIVTAFLICPKTTFAEDRELVLLDSDMVDLFDDGVAMMMLATSPKINLLGVTIVAGNNWSEDCTASAIRQLEAIGVKDVPVAFDKTPSKIKNRLKNLDKEFDKYGRGFDMHIGAAANEEPSDWISVYQKNYNAEPTFKPIDESAVDFIIKTIKNHPNQVTIVEIGPQTNLAAAIKKAPEIVPLVKKIVYMGGSFFQGGNVTPAAEFNIWFDPTSAKSVVRSSFKEQIFVPLDACEKIIISREDFDEFTKNVKSPILKEMIDVNKADDTIFEGAESRLIWDILAAAVVIDPAIIAEEITMPVDVNDIVSPSYGETLAYRIAPRDTQKARIILQMNQEKIIKLLQKFFNNL